MRFAPSRFEFTKTKMYFHFLSFPDIKMTQSAGIRPRDRKVDAYPT